MLLSLLPENFCIYNNNWTSHKANSSGRTTLHAKVVLKNEVAPEQFLEDR